MTDNVMRFVLDGFKNPNGCNLPATMFTLANEDTDCALAKGMYDDNYEIASHTKSHLNLDEHFTGSRFNEIVGARQKLAADCDIPMADIVGFRSPYLINNPQIRKVRRPASQERRGGGEGGGVDPLARGGSGRAPIDLAIVITDTIALTGFELPDKIPPHPGCIHKRPTPPALPPPLPRSFPSTASSTTPPSTSTSPPPPPGTAAAASGPTPW